MPFTIKKGEFRYKDPDSGEYKGVDAIGERTTVEMLAAIQEKGEETLASIPEDYTTLSNKVDDTVSSLNVERSSVWPYGNGLNRLLAKEFYTLSQITATSITNGKVMRYLPNTATFQVVDSNDFKMHVFDVEPNKLYMVMNGLIYTPYIPVAIFEKADSTPFATTELVETGTMYETIAVNNYFFVTPYNCAKVVMGEFSTIVPSLYEVTLNSNGVSESTDALSTYMSAVAQNGFSNDDSLSFTTESNKFLDWTGAVRSLTGDYGDWLVTSKITVEPCKYYSVTCSATYTSHCAYNIYDANDKLIKFDAADDSIQKWSVTLEDGLIFTPPNASYIRLATIHGSSTIAIYTTEANPLSNSNWSGKKWVCVGDSLTEVNSRTTMHYHDYIAQKTGISVVNLGKGGTGYKQSYSGNGPFIDRVNQIPLDADVVTIFGSGNDGQYSVGDPSDTGTDSLCSAINATIDAIQARITTVNIGIITPTPWIGYNPADDTNWMARYSAAIVEICRRRGIPCLDLYHCSNLRPWEAAFRTAAYSKDDGNGVHPDETGHALFAPRIQAFLDSLLLH